MKKFKQFLDTLNPNKSIVTRLSLWIAQVVAAVLIVVAVIMSDSVRLRIMEDTAQRADATMKNAEASIDNILIPVETSVFNSVPEIEDHINDPDYMYSIVSRLVDINPSISGSSISFEPNFYPGKYYYAPFAYRDASGEEEEELSVKQLGSPDYDYFCMDWYLIPKLLDKPYWSEPYVDAGGADFLMMTYTYPLKDKNGKFYGVITADVSLNWFTELLENTDFSPSAYNIVLSRNGTFLVHPNKSLILSHTLFSLAEELGNEQIGELGRDVVSGERGSASFDDEGGREWIFYAPIERNGWTMAIICPRSEFYATANSITFLIVILSIIGLIILAIICHIVLRRLLAPLQDFTKSADAIANGQFDTQLPEIESEDEMYRLSESFTTMQASLVEQMKELASVTEAKGRIEGELHVASNIQNSMLPKTFPPYPDCDEVAIYGQLTPAKEVGGDLYDFCFRDRQLYFCIGDVSGKGVPASLLMAVTRSLFRNLTGQCKGPAELVTRLNDAIAENNSMNMFVTFFAAVLDIDTGRLRFCNGGHNAPVLLKEEASFLELTANLPLGAMENWEFEEQETTLVPGESLFLYTDGLSEAENVDKVLFGDEQVLQVARQMVGKTVHAQIDMMSRAVARHAAGAQQSDDLTMMSVQYLGPGVPNPEKQ